MAVFIKTFTSHRFFSGIQVGAKRPRAFFKYA
jgi:hypothetical protein